MPCTRATPADFALVRQHLGGTTGPVAGAVARIMADAETLAQQVESLQRGIEALQAQTVRIREALGSGTPGQDTETIARETYTRATLTQRHS